MKYQTDDLRIKEIKELLPPAQVLGGFSDHGQSGRDEFTKRARRYTASCTARTTALLVIMGPCSIHD